MVPSSFIALIAALTGATRSEPGLKMKPNSSVPSGSPTILKEFGRGAHVAGRRGLIHEHEIDVAGLQRLHRGAEGVEQLYPRILLVAVEDVVDRGVEVGRAGLRADEQVLVGGEASWRR